jgi:putative SOS response-associated peptidase YedK
MVEWHDQLPVMVKPRDDEGWLSTDPVDDLRALLRAHPAGETQQNKRGRLRGESAPRHPRPLGMTVMPEAGVASLHMQPRGKPC